MAFKTSGSLTTTTKQVDDVATNISVSATLPTNTSASVTVKQDESGGKTADNSENVTLTDGTTTANLFSFSNTTGSTYWLTFSLSTSDTSFSPSVDSTTLTVSAVSRPSNVQITDNTTENELTVSWDAVSEADGYYVYRAESSGTTKSDYTQVANVTSSPYLDTGLSYNQKYHYRVSAYSSKGESELSSEQTGTTPELSLNSPTSLTANVTQNDVTLSWVDESSNEDGYRVYVSEDNTTWTEQATLASNAESYTLTGLEDGEKYYARVEAFVSGYAVNDAEEIQGTLSVTGTDTTKYTTIVTTST